MIVVTGATGKLGRLVVEGLLKKVPASQVVAAVRSPEKAADLARRGVVVRRADYNEPATLGPALAGAKKALLISSSEVGRRVAQHRAVIDAAKKAKVELFAYTSVLRADTNPILLAVEHKATEQAILESTLRFVLLRNGWYIENYTEHLAGPLAHGGFIGSAGNGRIAAAARADFAAAAVAVLTQEGEGKLSYELGGDAPFTMSELAAEVSAWAGHDLHYTDLPPAEYLKALLGAGVPEMMADLLVDTDLGIARGDLDTDSHDLHRLLGRATTTIKEALAAVPSSEKLRAEY